MNAQLLRQGRSLTGPATGDAPRSRERGCFTKYGPGTPLLTCIASGACQGRSSCWPRRSTLGGATSALLWNGRWNTLLGLLSVVFVGSRAQRSLGTRLLEPASGSCLVQRSASNQCPEHPDQFDRLSGHRVVDALGPETRPVRCERHKLRVLDRKSILHRDHGEVNLAVLHELWPRLCGRTYVAQMSTHQYRSVTDWTHRPFIPVGKIRRP